MALALNDRVQQTGTANTTVSFTLSGGVLGFQSFAVVGNGNTTYYSATDTSGNWEVGIGTYSTTGPTLTRTTILASSNSGSAVTFSGTVNVFVTYPSEKSVNQDANGNVNILTYVPNTNTYVGTLNVGDGTYSLLQSGQIATFAGADTLVSSISVQNTSSSNTAYSAIQVSADNYSNGYYLMLGTNSSTYSYAAAGYANNAANQPNANYIEANKSDLSIITWDANNIHFIQNASSATTDSMTLYATGGVSLGGNPDPGLGTLYANNVYLGFTNITAAAGTTVLTNSSYAWQQVVGTTTQTIQLPIATTLYKGLAFTITNNSTGSVTIKDSASTTIDTIVTGGSAIMVLTNNSTSAGSWVAYSYLPSSYDFSATTANFGNATITNALWNGTTIATGYGGTGLTTFAAANNAIYSTSSSALAAGTLPIEAGGTAATTFTANGVIYGNGTSALGVTAVGTTGQFLIGNTSSAPSWASLSSSVVTSLTTSSGLSTNTAATGAVSVTNTAPMVYPSGSGIAVVSSGTSWGTTLTAPSGAIVGTTDTQTLTNKRITSRIVSITGAAGGTITPTSDTADQYNITALGATATFAVPSGTPTDGQKLSIRIYSAAAQTISWTTTSTGYRIIGTTLPTTTGVGKTYYVGCVWNAADSYWDVVAVATQA